MVESADIEQRLFELQAIAYRAEPTDANFQALVERKKEPDDHASVTEVVTAVAARVGLGQPILGHLVSALALEERYQEATFLCRRWVDEEPSSVAAHRLAVLLACKHFDLEVARNSFERLKQLGAGDGTLWALETVLLLAFSDGHRAPGSARHALAALPQDPLAAVAALEVAYRNDDGDLLTNLLIREPDLVGNRSQAARALKLVRRRFVDVLRSREHKGSQ